MVIMNARRTFALAESLCIQNCMFGCMGLWDVGCFTRCCTVVVNICMYLFQRHLMLFFAAVVKLFLACLANRT